jgi:hypothetical protein
MDTPDCRIAPPPLIISHFRWLITLAAAVIDNSEPPLTEPLFASRHFFHFTPLAFSAP